MIVPGLGNLPCFPCASDKRPLIKAWRENAQPIEPPDHWPLVAVPTGIVFDVIDVDPLGLPWLEANRHLLQTRAHKTRRSWHFLFPPSGIGGSNDARIAPGVDIRALGNYVIWWPRQGYEVIDLPLAPWPVELLEKARRRKGALRKRNLPSQRAIGLGGLGGLSDGEALAALLKLDPVDYRDHDNWLRLMMAAHAAGIAPDVFIEWSTSDPKYGDDAEIISRRWESLTVEGNANGRVTAWALLVEARMVELERCLSSAHQPCTWSVPSTERTTSTQRTTERSTQRTPFQPTQPTQNLKLRMIALMRMVERAKDGDREPTLFRVACLVREIIAEGKLLPRIAIALLREACKANRLWQEDRELCCRTIAAGFLTVDEMAEGIAGRMYPKLKTKPEPDQPKRPPVEGWARQRKEWGEDDHHLRRGPVSPLGGKAK